MPTNDKPYQGDIFVRPSLPSCPFTDGSQRKDEHIRVSSDG